MIWLKPLLKKISTLFQHCEASGTHIFAEYLAATVLAGNVKHHRSGSHLHNVFFNQNLNCSAGSKVLIVHMCGILYSLCFCSDPGKPLATTQFVAVIYALNLFPVTRKCTEKTLVSVKWSIAFLSPLRLKQLMLDKTKIQISLIPVCLFLQLKLKAGEVCCRRLLCLPGLTWKGLPWQSVFFLFGYIYSYIVIHIWFLCFLLLFSVLCYIPDIWNY